MKGKTAVLIALAGMASTSALAGVVLVQTGDPGFYNNSIGTVLNGTNGGESGPFPVSNDSNLTFPTAPNLSAASGALGNWLTDPLNLNSNWQFLSSIPNSWVPGTEVAVEYEFNTLGATNVLPASVSTMEFLCILTAHICSERAGRAAFRQVNTQSMWEAWRRVPIFFSCCSKIVG